MKKEAGEKRVFLPEFIHFFVDRELTVCLEEGYGSRSGFIFQEYQRASEKVYQCPREDTFAQDLVIILRSPTLDEFELLDRNSCLISMLHYPTRPNRVNKLKGLNAKAISMDSVVNDSNLRLIENMHAVAWNGLEAAFDVLENTWSNLLKRDNKPSQVLIFGSGMIGKHAVEAATKLGNIERNKDHMAEDGAGSYAIVVGRNISRNSEVIMNIMANTDILVDATQRHDPSKPVIPNDWINWLPEHAIITDLAVDPYLLDANPPVVRGVEGIPQGNLDKYVFTPNDPEWGNTIPDSISTNNRRTVASCYSWPGIHPEASMRHYARQLEPLMEPIMEKGYDNLSPNGGYFERALFRGTLTHWIEHGAYGRRQR
jgi:alanine dehydrogenase